MKLKLLLSFLLMFGATKGFAQADLRPTLIFPVDYLPTGTHKFDLIVENLSSTNMPYNGFKVAWKLDNGAITEVSPATPTYPITSFIPQRVTGNFTINITTTGVHTLKVWTRSIAVTDANLVNDTIVKQIKVLSYLPTKNVLFEVYKHQACCPCIDAAAFEDTAIAPDPKYAVANIYTGSSDVLYNVDGDVINDLFNLSHPTAFIDRYRFPYGSDLENSFYTYNGDYLLRNFKERDRYYEPLEVAVTNALFDATNRQLKVKVKAKVYDTLSGNFRFNLYLTEDSVKAYQGCAEPDENQYYHSHVLRHMFGGTWGQVNSLPSKLYPTQDNDYEFTYTIPGNYKLNHLTLIAMVKKFDNDKMNSRVINSKKISFNNAIKLTNVETAFKEDEVQVYPNPSSDKIVIDYVNTSKESVNGEIIDMNGKLVRGFSFSGNSTTLNISNLPNGVYTIFLRQKDKVGSYQIIKN